MIREFNFMIGQELQEKIKNYCETKKISYNKCLTIIFTIMIPLLKKEHFTGEERGNKYQVFTAFKRIHLYLDEKLYRELKLIHSNLDFFSMAAIVRFLIEKFFERLEENNGDEKAIEREMREIWAEFNKAGVWWKLEVGQLFHPYLVISYNDYFKPEKIELFT